MSGKSSDDSNSDWEDIFEDALESISESTESDDTEKLTKEFEMLQFHPSQDESEKSDDRASSSDSWQKCDAADLQDDTSCEELPKTPDSRSSSDEESSRDEPIVVEKAPEEDQSDESAKKEEKDDKDSGPYQEAGTSGGFATANLNLAISLPLTKEWDGVVKYLVAEPELNEKLKDIKGDYSHFNKRNADKSSCDEEDREGLIPRKPKMLRLKDIKKIIKIMSGETARNKTGRVYRAIIMTIFIQELGAKEYHFLEIIATVLKFLDSGTRSLWSDFKKPMPSSLCEVFIDFLNNRCAALHQLELLNKQLQESQKEKNDEKEEKNEAGSSKSITQRRQATPRPKYCGNYLRDPYDDMMWQMCGAWGAWNFMWSPATLVRPGMWPPARP